MVGVERIRKILDVVLASTQPLNAQAVSACLICGSDGGKSELVLEHIPTNSVVLNDFHYAPIISLLNSKDPPRRIIVPDFNVVLSHRPVVATLTCAILLGLMGEGIDNIPGLDGTAKLSVDSLKKRGVTLSLLTGMTAQMFRSKRGKWRDTGFLRRMLPIYYKYSFSTVSRIQDYINDGHNRSDYPKNSMALPPRRNVTVDRQYLNALKELAEGTRRDRLVWFWENKEKGTRLPVQAIDYPFTLQKMLINTIMSHALLHDRTNVNDEDMTFINDLLKFVRYDFPEEI